jgi:anti-sigma factor RsiW
MSCSPFDLRDYFFGELPEKERRQVEAHRKICAACREELQRLESTQAVLRTVADEEIPQRIGFVSDRVYEPSLLRRWWLAFWESAPRLGFASAAMLSVAIVVSAMHRPTPPPAAPAIDFVGLQMKLQSDFSRQLNEAVTKAVAENDARSEQRSAELLAAATKRFNTQRESDREVFAQRLAIMEKYSRLDVRAQILGNGTR